MHSKKRDFFGNWAPTIFGFLVSLLVLALKLEGIFDFPGSCLGAPVVMGLVLSLAGRGYRAKPSGKIQDADEEYRTKHGTRF